jgi:hypothetical protein
MTRSSRYIRPAEGPGLRLQARDLDVLAAVARFELLTSEHMQELVFGATSRRFTNRRLRLLWAAGLLERRYLPEFIWGVAVRCSRPVYLLSRLGAQVLTDAGVKAEALTSKRWTMRHDLVAIDLLTAIFAALRSRPGHSVALTTERELRSRLRAWREGKGAGNRFPGLVPDGALTITTPGSPRALSYPVEVVRAGVKAGNGTLRAKMERYVSLNRSGFFKAAFGFGQIRAVLIVTTSKPRAETIRRIIERLPHGRNLFWLTAYERRTGLGASFEPGTVLAPHWTAVDGSAQALLGEMPHGAPPDNLPVAPPLTSNHLPDV